MRYNRASRVGAFLLLMSVLPLATTVAFPPPKATGGGGLEGAGPSPCTPTGKPTVLTCLACFQDILTQCDKDNQSAERRKACYDGANTYLEWCLGRTAANRAAKTAYVLPEWSYTEGLIFHSSTPVDVYVRNDGVQIKQAVVYIDGLVIVPPSATVAGPWVNVVIQPLDKQKVVTGAYATVVPFSLDRTGDGLVDDADLLAAVEQEDDAYITQYIAAQD